MEQVVEQAPKALRSFYGARDADSGSLAHNNTVKSLICPGERQQDIYSPDVIRDGLIAFWGEVELDPCWGPGSIIDAKTKYYVPPRVKVSFGKDGKEKKSIYFEAAPSDTDGLELGWVDGTYVNPPFKYLKKWLEKAVKEAARGIEIVFLSPVRSHRKWWRKAVRAATSCIELDPIKFVGYKSAFPQAMCLLYFGNFKSLFEHAFEKLGDPR